MCNYATSAELGHVFVRRNTIDAFGRDVPTWTHVGPTRAHALRAVRNARALIHLNQAADNIGIIFAICLSLACEVARVRMRGKTRVNARVPAMPLAVVVAVDIERRSALSLECV